MLEPDKIFTTGSSTIFVHTRRCNQHKIEVPRSSGINDCCSDSGSTGENILLVNKMIEMICALLELNG